MEASRRGRGLGRRLTFAAVDLARTLGVETLYLLTETAERFFGMLGFYPLPRAEVPDAVRVSAEFAFVCPASARAMRSLTTDGRVLRGTRAPLDVLACRTRSGGRPRRLEDRPQRPGRPTSSRARRLRRRAPRLLRGSCLRGVTRARRRHARRRRARGRDRGRSRRAAGASPEVAAAAIAGLGAALEIVDLTGPFDDLEQMIAGNLFHRGVVLGPTDPAWARRALDGVEARLVRGDRIAERVMAGEVVDDLADLVRLVADTLGAFGEILRAGDRIISGSITRPVAVTPGDVAGVDLGPLGALEVRFTE